ncbi:MAG: hypothetical protein ABSA17_08085 [Rhabdochlamydiaceae bacterium]|jgi:uncharacterized metal-binding protein YceD (DUF177 family)
MNEQLKIFTERLRNDHHEKFDLALPPAFLELNEKEIRAESPVAVKGEAYVLDDLLMLSFNLSTDVEMPCSICNAPTKVRLQNKNILISLPLSELPSAVYDPTDLIREEVVMLIPQFVECKKGACPARKELNPYLKKETQNFPFADLH